MTTQPNSGNASVNASVAEVGAGAGAPGTGAGGASGAAPGTTGMAGSGLMKRKGQSFAAKSGNLADAHAPQIEKANYAPDCFVILRQLLRDFRVDKRFIRIDTKRGTNQENLVFYILSPVAYHALFGADTDETGDEKDHFHFAGLLNMYRQMDGRMVQEEGFYKTRGITCLETRLKDPSQLDTILAAYEMCPNGCGVMIDRYKDQVKHLRQYCRVQVERNMREAEKLAGKPCQPKALSGDEGKNSPPSASEESESGLSSGDSN